MYDNLILYEFLGKKIENLPFNCTLKSKLEYSYIYELNLKGAFLSVPFNKIRVVSNRRNIITEVSFCFLKVIDNSIFELYNNKFGYPDNILKPDKIVYNEEWENEEFKSTKVVSKLKETSFENNPILIKWNKKDYQVRIFLKHELNISEVIFSLFPDKI